MVNFVVPPTIRFFLAPCMSDSPNEVLHAYTEQPGRTIIIDPRSKRHLVRLIIHETLHVKHPSWTETRVVLKTRYLYQRLTCAQKAKILIDAIKNAQIGYPPKEEKDA